MGSVVDHVESSRLRRKRIVAVLAVGLLPGCGDDGAVAADDGGTTGSALPSVCDPAQSPFFQQECLRALRRTCNAIADAESCAENEPFRFDTFTLACSWAKVVRFGEPQTCGLPEADGRCELQHTVWTPCQAACTTGLQAGAPSDLWASVDGTELMLLCNAVGMDAPGEDPNGGVVPAYESCSTAEEPSASCTCVDVACASNP